MLLTYSLIVSKRDTLGLVCWNTHIYSVDSIIVAVCPDLVSVPIGIIDVDVL